MIPRLVKRFLKPAFSYQRFFQRHKQKKETKKGKKKKKRKKRKKEKKSAAAELAPCPAASPPFIPLSLFRFSRLGNVGEGERGRRRGERETRLSALLIAIMRFKFTVILFTVRERRVDWNLEAIGQQGTQKGTEGVFLGLRGFRDLRMIDLHNAEAKYIYISIFFFLIRRRVASRAEVSTLINVAYYIPFKSDRRGFFSAPILDAGSVDDDPNDDGDEQ
ncbi:hypothetical protein PUN28_000131 [Cardiocondyla obscurior]|uniref:Uncharacterized protein n=1 Tax=Cardiocondyla obscurior TaxID=286306 RepID=A0AAW2GYD2_9HYME